MWISPAKPQTIESCCISAGFFIKNLILTLYKIYLQLLIWINKIFNINLKPGTGSSEHNRYV
jgi:hypothetical protein